MKSGAFCILHSHSAFCTLNLNTRPKSRFWRICRIYFRRLRITVWLLILALLGALVYLNQIGLPNLVKKPLLEKLRASGIDLQFSRLRLSWSHGILAEDVRFGRSNDPLSPKLTLAEVQVGLNHRALAKLRIRIDSLLLRQGRLVCPIEETNRPLRRLSVEDIQTDLRLLPNDEWALDNFRAAFAGAKVQLAGTISNASALREWRLFQANQQAPAAVWQDRVRKLADTLDSIHFSAPPELRLDVHGDARDPQSFDVLLALSAPGADTPWGLVTRGRATVRLTPATNNALSQARLRLTAEAAQTRWAATTNLQLIAHVAWVEAQSNLVRGDLALSARQVQTEWGRATNVQFTAHWVHALTNAVPLSGQGEVQCETAECEWGSATNIRLAAHLQSVAASSPLPTLSHPMGEGQGEGTNWAWWTNIEPYLLDWQCRLSDLRSSKLQAEAVACDGSWRAPELQIVNLHAGLYQGNLDGSAGLDVATRVLNGVLASDFDPHKASPLLTQAAQHWLAQFSWEQPPHLKAEISLVLPQWTNRHPDWRAEVQPTLRLQGEFKTDRGAYRDVPVIAAHSHFGYSNLFWRLPDLAVTRPEGAIQAAYDADDRTKDYYWRIHSGIDASSLRPLLEPTQQSGLDYFSFSQPPVIDAEIRGRWHDPERTTVKGRVALTNFTFRGESASGFQTAVEYTNLYLRLSDAHLQRGTQHLSAAGLEVDFISQKIYLTNGISTAEPEVVARAIGPKVERAIEPYHFEQPPTVRVQGIIPIHDEEDANLRFEIEGGPFHWWKFNVPRIAGKVHWLGQQLTLTDIRAGFYGGDATGSAALDFSPEQGTGYRFEISTTNTQLQWLMADLSPLPLAPSPLNGEGERGRGLEGSLSGSLVITSANSEDWRTIEGHADVDLRDGLIWSIPIFGIFSPVLDSVAPGLGSSRASAGTGTFIITNGVLWSDDLEISSPAMRLEYRGTVDLEGQVNARVEAQLLRDVWGVGPIISSLFWPVTKMFEYKVTGSLSQPKSEPVFFIPKIVQLPFHPFRTLKGLFPEDSTSTGTNAPPVLDKTP